MKYLALLVVLGLVLGLVVAAVLTIIPKHYSKNSPSIPQAHHENLQYDPSKCSTDPHGMVYVALGRRVIRQPKENLFYIHGGPKEEIAKFPSPPKPSDPEGCPDHPMWGFGFNFSSISSTINNKPLNSGGGVELIYDETLHYYGAQSANEEFYTKICQEYHIVDESTVGLIGCLWPLPTNPKLQQCRPAVYQAKQEVYATPGDHLFTLNCMVDWINNPCRIICDVSYKLYDDLNVGYKVDTSKMPVKDIIDYDRELRRRVKEAEVPNYPWPQK